ncbi:MAG: bifunctional oligoribonuclease/PAP phosphatase NrnA [Candidatus Saganbacteria bacterium]|nr:bifunctional oligoribonuclease/PAP phosphatase NrnA [Candidatus Saganbacteria bacterium]
MRRIYESIKLLIKNARTILIAGHIDPDGDTLGSMIALHLILEKLGKKSDMCCQDKVPPSFLFLSGADKIRTSPKRKEYDLFFTVDASDLSRTGNIKVTAKHIINIDHHADNTNFGDINCVELLSSVAEQIYKLAKELNVEINQEIAKALYVSIITDTGNFRYANTLPSTFEVACDLVLRGAIPSQIASAVYDTKTIAGMKVLSYALDKIEKRGKLVWSSLSHEIIKKTGATHDDLICIIDYLRAIKDTDVTVFLREEKENTIKVNLRSKGRTNVSKIANDLGGGGHIQAAGVTLNMPLLEAEEKVISTVMKNM